MSETPVRHLFDAMAEGQDERLAQIILKAKELFETRSLSDRYNRLLNIHQAICPTVPRAEVERGLAIITGSDDMQMKYDFLEAQLAGQIDLLETCDDINPDDLDLGAAGMNIVSSLLDEANKQIQEATNFIRQRLDRIESSARMAEAEEKLSATGRLFPAPRLQ